MDKQFIAQAFIPTYTTAERSVACDPIEALINLALAFIVLTST
jgi:hypothetical protein